MNILFVQGSGTGARASGGAGGREATAWGRSFRTIKILNEKKKLKNPEKKTKILVKKRVNQPHKNQKT